MATSNETPAPPVAHLIRQRAGRVASLIAAAGLVLGVIALIWDGGLSPLALTGLIAGGVALAVWVILTPDDALALVRRRGLQRGTVTVFGTAVLVGLIVSVYLAAQRSAVLIDLTASGDYSLSGETRNVLDSLTRRVQISGFYSASALPQRELDDQFFRLYAAETGGEITIRYYDPVTEPAIAEAFGAQFDGDVFVSYVDAAGQPELDTSIRVVRAGAQERDVTRALVLLSRAGTYRIAFEIGYSRVQQNDTSETGLSAFIDGLEFNGFVTGAVNLRSMIETPGGFIPDDVSVVVMTQMIEDLPAEAVARVADYVGRGGKLLIMADSDLAGGAQFIETGGAFNAWLWETFGLRMMDGVVVDPAISGATVLDVLSAAIPEDSDLTRGLNDPADQSTAVEFHIARPIDINPSPPVPNGLLIAASPASYAELDLETLIRANQTSFDINEDVAGPMNTAAWADNPDTGARIVLIGDDDFATNRYVGSPVGNSILLTNAITWLTGFSERVVFEPQGRATGIPTIFVTGQQLDQISFVTVVLLPGLVVLAGMGVWYWRARR